MFDLIRKQDGGFSPLFALPSLSFTYIFEMND